MDFDGVPEEPRCRFTAAPACRQDAFLALALAQARTLRIADGPDEVHLESIARQELRKHR